MNLDPYALVLPFAILILTVMLSARIIHEMNQQAEGLIHAISIIGGL